MAMDTTSNAPSRRVSVVVDDGDLPETALTADSVGLDYANVINYSHSAKGAAQTLVLLRGDSIASSRELSLLA